MILKAVSAVIVAILTLAVMLWPEIDAVYTGRRRARISKEQSNA